MLGMGVILDRYGHDGAFQQTGRHTDERYGRHPLWEPPPILPLWGRPTDFKTNGEPGQWRSVKLRRNLSAGSGRCYSGHVAGTQNYLFVPQISTFTNTRTQSDIHCHLQSAQSPFSIKA